MRKHTIYRSYDINIMKQVLLVKHTDKSLPQWLRWRTDYQENDRYKIDSFTVFNTGTCYS